MNTLMALLEFVINLNTISMLALINNIKDRTNAVILEHLTMKDKTTDITVCALWCMFF